MITDAFMDVSSLKVVLRSDLDALIFVNALGNTRNHDCVHSAPAEFGYLHWSTSQ